MEADMPVVKSHISGRNSLDGLIISSDVATDAGDAGLIFTNIHCFSENKKPSCR